MPFCAENDDDQSDLEESETKSQHNLVQDSSTTTIFDSNIETQNESAKSISEPQLHPDQRSSSNINGIEKSVAKEEFEEPFVIEVQDFLQNLDESQS